MARWWLFNGWGVARKKMLAWIPFSIRIHYIATADEDRELHDHPWPARTFVLKGWYREIRLVDVTCMIDLEAGAEQDQLRKYFRGEEQLFTRRAGDTATLGFEEFHRIVEISEGGVYTLFLSWPWAGDWGFLSPSGLKVWWREWLGIPESEEMVLAHKDINPYADSPALLQAERALAAWRRDNPDIVRMAKVFNTAPDWTADDEPSLALPRRSPFAPKGGFPVNSEENVRIQLLGHGVPHFGDPAETREAVLKEVAQRKEDVRHLRELAASPNCGFEEVRAALQRYVYDNGTLSLNAPKARLRRYQLGRAMARLNPGAPDKLILNFPAAKYSQLLSLVADLHDGSIHLPPSPEEQADLRAEDEEGHH